MDRTLAKLAAFSSFCASLATLSTCKRAKCAAIVFPRDFTSVLAIGYNGPPRGAPNNSCYDEPGNCGCVHAEANALLKFHEDYDAVMLSSTAPCLHCAGLIINSQAITKVIWKYRYRDDRGLSRLTESSIEVVNIDDLVRQLRESSSRSE